MTIYGWFMIYGLALVAVTTAAAIAQARAENRPRR